MQIALRNQFLLIYFPRIWVFGYEVVQFWLRKFGFIALIVSVFAVAEHIHIHIFAKFLPKFHRKLHRKHNGFGIVAVYVQHGRIGYFGYGCAVIRRAGILKIGGKPNLVVYHKMQRTAHGIARQLAHLRHFIHNALPRQSRIAVYHYRHYLRKIALIYQLGFAAQITQQNGVHSLQMRRIWYQRKVNIFAIAGFSVRRKTQVVLHIAIAEGSIVKIIALKLIKNVLVGFAQYICQHIEPATVRHAYRKPLYAQFCTLVYNSLEGWYGVFAALERKSFLPHVFFVQKVFEGYGFIYFRKNLSFLIQRIIVIVGFGLKFLLAPLTHFGVAYVHKLKANFSGINGF